MIGMWSEHGHYVYRTKGGITRYLIDDAPFDKENPRPCARCGMHPTKDGVDACIGRLIPGMRSTCCGHGIDDPYFVTDGGVVIRIEGLYTPDRGPEPITLIKKGCENAKTYTLDEIGLGGVENIDGYKLNHKAAYRFWYAGEISNYVHHYKASNHAIRMDVNIYISSGPLMSNVPMQVSTPRNLDYEDTELHSMMKKIQHHIYLEDGAPTEDGILSNMKLIGLPSVRMVYNMDMWMNDHNDDIRYNGTNGYWTQDTYKKTGTCMAFDFSAGPNLCPMLIKNYDVWPILILPKKILSIQPWDEKSRDNDCGYHII